MGSAARGQWAASPFPVLMRVCLLGSQMLILIREEVPCLNIHRLETIHPTFSTRASVSVSATGLNELSVDIFIFRFSVSD